ncbi:hypothetical protein LZV00_25745 [Pseudomonas kielensis]|uniref:hypothetical protein n=1 Tax=Pseudomonas kielensis TaxID=2762577 RepID=UPI00223FA5F2|nr:hypothetical protein [Pseudomonas kielensis]UZM13969.1 hypothetical protein LZV00_25745 [Pseudomonas kielensis]
MNTAASAIKIRPLRVLVMGGPGSGTSTLAAALAEQLAWRHLETDDFQWLDKTPPFTRKVDETTRLLNMLDALNGEQNVVVSGSIVNWGNALENAFDLVVFRVLDTSIRLQRLIERERRLYTDIDPAFIDWAAQYEQGGRPGRSRASHEAWLGQCRGNVLRLEGDLELVLQVSLVVEAMEALS